MKKIFFVLNLIFSFQGNAQWNNAILDTLTHNNIRDEINHQSMAIDDSEMIHIVYARENSGLGWNIFYKKRNTFAQWSDEESVTTQIGFNPVITSSKIPGHAFISFEAIDSSDSEIYVCSDSSGTWNCIQVTSDHLNETRPTIAVDDLNFIHLAWITENSPAHYKINYATNIGGNWVIQELTGSQLGQLGNGASPEIAVDKSGNAHISYRGNNGNGYRIHHAFNNAPGGSIWNYNIITTPNDQDGISVIKIDEDTVVHLLVSGNDGFGMPAHAYYHTKKYSDLDFSQSVEVATSFLGQAGDFFIDKNKIPHFVLNEVNANIYTGNVIYADSTNWSGTLLFNSGDIFNANLVMDSEDNAYLLAYRGNSFPEEEIVFYGIRSVVGIADMQNKLLPYKLIAGESNLKIFFEENYSGKISVTALDGRIVFDKQIDYSNGKTLSIENLSGGIYVIYMEKNKERNFQKIFLR